MSKILYSNSDFTFGVKVFDSLGAVIDGSTYAVAEWRLYGADNCTVLASKTLGAGITATSGTFSFTVTYEEADIQVASFAYNTKGILTPNGSFYRHAFYVGTLAGDKQPSIFNEQVDIYPECDV